MLKKAQKAMTVLYMCMFYVVESAFLLKYLSETGKDQACNH